MSENFKFRLTDSIIRFLHLILSAIILWFFADNLFSCYEVLSVNFLQTVYFVSAIVFFFEDRIIEASQSSMEKGVVKEWDVRWCNKSIVALSLCLISYLLLV